MSGCSKCTHDYCEDCRVHHEQEPPVAQRELDVAWSEHQRAIAQEEKDVQAKEMDEYAISLVEDEIVLETQQVDTGRKFQLLLFPKKRKQRRKTRYLNKKKQESQKKFLKLINWTQRQKLVKYKEAKAETT